MEIIVYGPDRQAIGIIERAKSLIWTDRYKEPGDFELSVEPTAENITMLARDNFISIVNSDTWMVIESQSIRTDAENGDSFIVSGRSLISLFDRRQMPDNTAWGCGGLPPPGCDANDVMGFMVLYAFTDSYGTEKEVTYIVDEASSDTRIDGVKYEFSTEFRTGHSNKNILDILLEVQRIFGHGLTMHIDSNDDLAATWYRGQDRTVAQTDNPAVIFSPEFGNLSNSELLISDVGYKTITYIHGAPEPPPAPVYNQDLSPAGSPFEGLERREGFTDGSGVSPYLPGTSTPKASADYQNDLEEFGLYDLLYNMNVFNAFSGKIEQHQFYYGQDYFLGDIVTFQNGYGFSGDAMIVEVTFSFDESGDYIYPTFEFIE